MSAGRRTAGRAVSRRRVIPAVLILLTAALGVLTSAPQAALAASPGAASISAAGWQSCAVESGQGYCWGANKFTGNVGSSSAVPVAVDTSGVLAGKTLTQISASYDYSACVLDRAGAAYCWGVNADGELGDGTTAEFSTPVAVDTSGALAGKTLAQVTVGIVHACALDITGAAYCWGRDRDGELGDGGAASSDVPVPVDTRGVLAGTTLTQITAGDDATCALDSSGAAYCWGANANGQLGDGSTAGSSVPVSVDTSGVLAGKSLTQIAIGDDHSCALDSAGAAYCWGDNSAGELGDGTTVGSRVPVAVDASGVLAGQTLTQIAAGQDHTCALDSAGAAYCWGDNSGGELGDGTTVSSSVPVAVNAGGVLASQSLTQIAAGDDHTCALDSSGAAYCWGGNNYGDLGDDTATLSDVPVLAGPQAPASAHAVLGRTTAAVSWFAPAGLDTGTVTGYTATASPGGAACSTISTTCTITGLTGGTTYSVTVVAHTTVGDSSASVPATVTPTGGGPAFTSAAAGTAAFGAPFSFTVTATGSPEPAITKSGALPSGIRFTAGAHGMATIAGTPKGAVAGIYPVTLTARDQAGTATQAFTLTVTRAPAIRKVPATTAATGVRLNLVITTTGYPLAVFTESGPLPAGLGLIDNENGTAALAGTPAAGSGGSYPVTITATNPAGTASQALILKVNQPPAITSAAAVTAVIGSAFSLQVTATGFPAPRITRSGTLPKGLTFTSAAATFSGTPRAGTSGSYPITITARSSAGTITQNLTLTIT
jgi:alpha-tubulin suppressor-like RCC1 family protein